VVAHVYLVDGAARIIASNGFSFRAAPGIPLLRTDEVEAPVGGFVVLKLKNNYLTRIDEEVVLKASDIVMLNAAVTTESFEHQLERLLSKKEREKGERIAGWHARLHAAQTIPPQAAAKKVERKAMREVEVEEQPRAKVAPEAPAEAAEKKIRRKGKRESKVERRMGIQPPTDGAGVGAPLESVAKAKDEEDDEMPINWYIQVDRKRTAQTGPLPALVRELVGDLEFRACVKTELDRLPAKVRVLTILIRLEDRRVKRIVLGGGLHTPECARKRYADRSLPEGPVRGWVVLEVELP
jgi:hypothetical protein